MSIASIRQVVTIAVALALPGAAAAQTADAVIDKSLAALGGRAAFVRLKSRVASGTIVLSTPGGDISGTIEVLNAAPNKSRTVIKADLSALGLGPLTIDQRFNGSEGYVLDSLQGDRAVTGGQLDNMRNSAFPHPFINYKDLGTSATLGDKEKVGDRDALVVVFDPTSGAVVRHYIDAETFLPLKTVVRVDVPQLGTEVEQSNEFSDYRDVDGIKLPFRLRSSSSAQSFTVTLTKVEHNVPVDDALFSRPVK